MSATAKHDSSGRKVLEGIERIHWETTSPLCFVGSTLACMHYLGEPVSNDFLMGVSGGAFTFLWYPGWSPAECDILILGEEPVRQTFGALGYEYTYLPAFGRPGAEAVRASFRERVVESIDRDIPVIAQGIVGPAEACVLAGYDRGGQVVYGWSYFQENPNGYFRAENWEKDCSSLILVGKKGREPAPRQVLVDALEWAIALGRTPQRDCTTAGPECNGMHHSGLAAYDGMIEALARDGDYPAGNLDVLSFRSVVLGNDGICLLWSKRGFAASFVNSMAEAGHPGAGELRRAGEAYKQEVEVLRRALDLTPVSFGPEAKRLKLAERSYRDGIATLVRAAKVHEERALQHLEGALAQLKKA